MTATSIPDKPILTSSNRSVKMTRTDVPVYTLREQVKAMGNRLMTQGPRLTTREDVDGAIEKVKAYIREHQMLSLVVGIVCLLGAIPVIAFICFVIATLGFTFLGFIFVEGTLLTVGTFLLSGVLLLLGLIALGFSAFIAITWFFFSKAYGMANTVSQRFLNVQPARAAVASATNASNRNLQHVD